jgi:2-C-methyl-D-erythritol 4-phosphate cytidylyltransferase/2-C-methyl-D-erythritol 2,4-cyclodiphosphate synthase
MTFRIGSGFDVHQFEPGNAVILGGVHIPHDKKLKGHSDADAVLHAVTDALLGAIGKGDIGEHFPPSDPKWKGADSIMFLKHALELAKAEGYKVGNVDVTILAEEPKISPYKNAIKKKLAEILEIEESCSNVKATTTEKLGFIGRSEGLAAEAVILLTK